MRTTIEEIEAYSKFVDQAISLWHERIAALGSHHGPHDHKDLMPKLDWPGQE